MTTRPQAPGYNRRDFLELGATTAAAAAFGRLSPGSVNAGAGASRARPTLRTELCDLLGIEYPIIQAGMSGVAGPELVAAVSGAGGLGILTGTLLPPDELRTRIRRVRALTDRPFGVNLLLHTALRPPLDTAAIPEQTLRAVQALLNRFRTRLGLAASFTRPPTVPESLTASFETMLEERVPVWSIGLGQPTADMVERCHAAGTRVIAMVATVEDAATVAGSGVDAIVAQGSEAGGHRSTWVKRASPEEANIGSMALIPQVADRVTIPVVAAGGITNGRGLVAAIALGAQGVLIGTRFIATRESIAPEFHKTAVLATSSDRTTVTDVYTGMYARTLRNDFTEQYASSGAPVLPPFTQFLAAQDIFAAAATHEERELFTLYCGQGAGAFRDMPDAAKVVRQIVAEAIAEVGSLPRRMRLT